MEHVKPPRIVIIAPRQGLVVHSGLDVFDKKSAILIDQFIKIKEAEYGELDRVIISMGTTRVMDPQEKIPVPPVWGELPSSLMS